MPATEPERHAGTASHVCGWQGIRVYWLREKQGAVHGDGGTRGEPAWEGGLGGACESRTRRAGHEDRGAAVADDYLHARGGSVGPAAGSTTARVGAGERGARAQPGYGESRCRAARATGADSRAAVGARPGI